MIINSVEQLRVLSSKWLGRDFAFDTETTGVKYRKKHRLLGLALKFRDGYSYYIVLQHTVPTPNGVIVKEFISVEDFQIYVAPLFNQPDVMMLAHNMKFDLGFLATVGIYINGKIFDTLLAAQLLDENRKNGLKELAPLVGMYEHTAFSDLHEYSEYGKKEILGVPLEKVAEYAEKDVITTELLYDKFAPELADEGLERVFYHVWMPLLIVLQKMEARGIALDLDLVRELKAEYEKIRDEKELEVRRIGTELILQNYRPADLPKYYLNTIATEEDLEQAYTQDDGTLIVEKQGIKHPIITYDMVGKTARWSPRLLSFSTSSSTQLGELVYKWSNVKIPTEIELKRTPSGNDYSVDKDNLETLIFYNDDPPPFLQYVLDWRKAEKFINTYLDRFLEDADPDDHNSISTVFSQAVAENGRGGTATGRLSSADPNLNIRALVR